MMRSVWFSLLGSKMMDDFSATLEACGPSLSRIRSYRLEVNADLFGAWLAAMVFGRIGPVASAFASPWTLYVRPAMKIMPALSQVRYTLTVN